MNFQVKAGNLEVLCSGVVMQIANNPISFTFDNLTFVMQFEESKKDPYINVETTPQSMTLHFYNFNSVLGTFNNEPIELATLNNRKLYLSYNIQGNDNLHQCRRIMYTFYLGN